MFLLFGSSFFSINWTIFPNKQLQLHSNFGGGLYFAAVFTICRNLKLLGESDAIMQWLYRSTCRPGAYLEMHFVWAKDFCISEAEVCSNSVRVLTSVELKTWQEILLLFGLGIFLRWKKWKHLPGTCKPQYLVWLEVFAYITLHSQAILVTSASA